MGCDVLRKYWNQQHIDKNKKALTGSSLNQYCEFFGLTKAMLAEKSILEIGVGLGRATAEIGALTDNLDALDISPVAIANVTPYIRNGFINVKELPRGVYDIAISYLVAQHMDDSDLIIQIEEILKALKSNGILYMQFADAYTHNLPVDLIMQKGGGVLRTREEMDKLVAYAGGDAKIIAIKKINRVTWYGVAIRRK